ncbi:MAG: hypothetical protein JXB46_04275 [Candidatus Eisenbacteria bacterium]|nr:hypothetical protein [Candidatus Eisenbacteria bacterium]
MNRPTRTLRLAVLGGAILTTVVAVAAGAAELSDEEQEQFLLDAKLEKYRSISTGVTGTKRLTLTNGELTHDAHFQSIDVSKTRFETPLGVEMLFRDCYKFNIAAYRLDRLINLNMIPTSVERRLLGQKGSVTWWVDDVQMMELERQKKNIQPPDPVEWNDQMYQIRVFNELVYNTDPNLGNLLITKDWRIRLIDFSRAFRLYKTLRNEGNLGRIDRRVYEGLKSLDLATLTRELGELLRKPEIEAILARRDKIVQFFDEKVAHEGEAAVFCDQEGH